MVSSGPPTYSTSNTTAGTNPSELPGYSEVTTAARESRPTFRFREHQVQSFVDLAEVKSYLSILAAFQALKTKVEESEWRFEETDKKGAPDSQPLAEVKWALFIERAVGRFSLWMHSLEEQVRDSSATDAINIHGIPPLDVMLILHTFMLSPHAYYELSLTHFTCLTSLVANFPWALAASQISAEDLNQVGHPTQIKNWEAITHTPFDPPFQTSSKDTVQLTCPACQTVSPAPWLTTPTLNKNGYITSGEGYAQSDFKLKCSDTSCGRTITHDMLRVGRLLQDLSQAVSNDSNKIIKRHGRYFSLPKDVSVGLALELIDIAYGGETVKHVSVSQLGDFYKWRMPEVHTALKSSKEFQGRESVRKYGLPRVDPLMAAYASHEPFIVDLVASTLRLRTFIDALPQQYLYNGDQEVHDSALNLAIGRYHNFLFLHGPINKSLEAYAAANGSSPALRKIYTPTLDIDLAWHVHMLRPKDYRNDHIGLLGRVLNHGELFEEGKLSADFDKIVDRYKTAFNASYSSCSCLNPPSKSTGRKFWQKTSPAIVNFDPQFQHPSDHNGIVVRGNATLEHFKALRDHRVEKTSEKGKAKAITSYETTHDLAFAHKFHENAPNFWKFGLQGWGLSAPFDAKVVDASDELTAIQVSGAHRAATAQQLLRKDGKNVSALENTALGFGDMGGVSFSGGGHF